MDHQSRPKKEEEPNASNNNNVFSSQASKVSKEHKSARKLQNLSTRISVDVHKRFKQFVLNKHGKINGPYAQEVEYALEFYMNTQQQTTSSALLPKNLGHRRSDVKEKYLRMAKELKLLKTFPLINIPTMKNVVRAVLGETDPRTYNKYLKDIAKLSKEEEYDGCSPLFDVTRFVNKVQGDDW